MKLVPVSQIGGINSGLSPAKHATMMKLFGKPGPFGTNCAFPTGPVVNKFTQKVVVITPKIRVRALSPAVASLKMVFNDIKKYHPELWSIIGTAGMTCCRAVRGSDRYYSNHSWGTAIDLTIGGILAPLNATRVPYGLIVCYGYFHKYGWFWAQGYRGRTDPMHQEVAQETLLRWKKEGVI